MATYLANVMVQVEIDGPDESVIADALQDYIGDGDDNFRVHSVEVLDFEELN
jgi:phosphotransferase system HPr-like phosphotransfer protein